MYRSRMFFRESVLQTLVVLLGLCLMSLASCNDSHEKETQKGIRTLLMYLPYSTDLQDILQTNMNDLLAGVEEWERHVCWLSMLRLLQKPSCMK